MKTHTSGLKRPLGQVCFRFPGALVLPAAIVLTFLLAPGLLFAQNADGPAASEVTVTDIGSEQPNPAGALPPPPGQASDPLAPGSGPAAAGDFGAASDAPGAAGQSEGAGFSPAQPAAQTPAAPGASQPASGLDSSLLSSGMDLAKAAGAFILVIILLVVCLKFIGYLSRGRHAGRGSKAFTLRGTLVLDNRRYLAAVEVDGHLVVLGVTPERLTSLAHWSMEDETADEAPAPGPRLRAPARTAQAPPRQAPAPARAARPGPAVAAPPRPQPPQAPQAAPAAPESRDVPGREASDVLLLDDPVEAPAPPRRAPQAASRASTPAPEPSLVAGPGAALAEGQQSAANGPSLGSSLVEDAFDRSLDGPNVSLSLDEDAEGALDGPQANDDFLKLFQDDFEKK